MFRTISDELQYYLTLAEVAAIVTAEGISSNAMKAAAATATVRVSITSEQYICDVISSNELMLN